MIYHGSRQWAEISISATVWPLKILIMPTLISVIISVLNGLRIILGCEYSNHAPRCHFDPAGLETSARVSGGVCDDCQDNTMGRNCEICNNYFYQDPSKQMTDVDVRLDE